MGPNLICDKSTLQALSRDELSALRRYYSLNIPPVLLVEILADLKKHVDGAAGREEVRILANKLLPACSTVNMNFRKLIIGELGGQHFPMDCRPVVQGGFQVDAQDGKKGVMLKVSPEADALLRWQTNEFSEAEELLAEAWRLSTLSIDLEGMQRHLRSAYSGHVNLRTLAQTAQFVDELIRTTSPKLLFEWFLNDADIFGPSARQAVEKFQGAADGSLFELAPYTAFCVRVGLIFHFALAFGLVSTRPTNRLDLEYLYYSPFCNAFSSGDAFHRKIAPLVIPNGKYFDREVLKADLNQLAKWWTTLSPEQEEQESHVQGPPENENSITHQLWKELMRPGYRDPGRRHLNLTKEASDKMLKRFQDLARKGSLSEQPLQGSAEDCDFMIVQHMVRPDGPCICGKPKLFKECCGRELVKSLKESGAGTVPNK